MLFTANELISGGAVAGQFIDQIGFNVVNYHTIALNQLMFRLKDTDAQSLSGFDPNSASFHTGYLDTYSFSETGWCYFEFSEPFVWNGTQNLLLDVSFNNTSWGGNTVVFASPATGKTWAQNADGADGATLNGGNAQANRPNTRFVFRDSPGGEPELLLSPLQYDFGSVNIYHSASKSFSIMNSGGGSLGINSIEVSGSDAFTLAQLPALPLSLEFSETTSFSVVYTPTQLEADNADIIITDALGNTHIATVSGTCLNEITIGSGSLLGRVPMNFYYRSSLYEYIFTQDELTDFVGLISGIKFYNSFYTNLMQKPVKIWLGSTTQSNLSAGWIPATELELVFDGNVNFPAGEHTISITFAQPYRYLDSRNLVMMVQRPLDGDYYSVSDVFKTQVGLTNSARSLQSDTDDFDPNLPPTGDLISNFPKTSFVVTPSRVGHVTGIVRDANNTPIPDVTVHLQELRTSVQTNAQGEFSFTNQLSGNYLLNFAKHAYLDYSQNISIQEDETLQLQIVMQPMPRVNVSGVILANDNTAGISGANITLFGYEDFQLSTQANGTFVFENVFANQSYSYLISATGYTTIQGNIDVQSVNYDMGTIVLNEISYAPNYLVAELNLPQNAVLLSWNAPDPNALEIIEGFEDAVFPPNDWSQGITNTGEANNMGIKPTWCSFGSVTITGSGTVNPTEGSKQAGLWWDHLHQDEWLYSPAFSCPSDAYLSFDTYAHYGSEAGDHYYVKVSNNGGNSWAPLWDASTLPTGDNHYDQAVSVDLSAYVGMEIMLAFHAEDPPTNDGLWNMWFIDNIYIGNMAQRYSLKLDTKSADRAVEGYRIWRLALGQENNETSWISLSDDVLTALNFEDSSWSNLPNGHYKWAVKAIYTAGVSSAASFSNALQKYQQNGNVVGFVRRPNGQGIAGATVSASNGSSSTTNSAGAYSLVLPVGVYDLTASANGFQPHTIEGVNIAPNQNVTVNFELNSSANEDELTPVTITRLNGNYPNPFNPETTVSYDIKDAGSVSLEIYNLRGQLVRTLVKDTLPSGRYRTVFNARDDKGLPLGSGVYFYRFVAGDYHATRKMLLME